MGFRGCTPPELFCTPARELLSYFREGERSRVEETSPGIYAVGGYPVVIQVIESKKTAAKEALIYSTENN
jgi:hypothetical protein